MKETVMLLRFLILVHVCKAFPFKCPEQAQWSLHARGHCSDTSNYFCLKNYLISGYSENCTAFNYLAPGKVIYGNETTCNEEGQLINGKGTHYSDTSCRFDYTSGYDFLIKPQNPCFFVPSQEDCSCYLKACPNSKDRLSPDYECVQKEKNLSKCETTIYKRLNSTINKNTMKNITRISAKQETIKIELIIFSICSVVFFFVIVISGLYMLHKIQPGLSEARNGLNPLHIMENEQLDQDESIYDIYDVIDESQMIDTPSQQMPTEYQGNENSSSVAANEEINSGDGYLNPYQPMVPDLDHHGYVVSSNTT